MIEVVAATISDKDNKVLLAKRSYPKKLENKWEFPGGKIGENEDPKHALKREIKEELGINVLIKEKIMDFKHSYEFKDIFFRVYLTNKKDKSQKISLKEHKDFSWVSLEELNGYDLAEADKEIATELIHKFDP